MAISPVEDRGQELGGVKRFFKRRRYIVDRELQFSLIRAHLILFSTALGFLAIGIFSPLVTELNGSGLPDERMLTAATMMLYMHERMWLLFGLTSVFLVLGLLRLSHKVAGPLHRFRQVLGEARAGSPRSDIRLRRGDFLHREAQLLNRLLADMSARGDMLRETGADVKSLRAKIMSMPGLNHKDRDGLMCELDRMRASLKILMEGVSVR